MSWFWQVARDVRHAARAIRRMPGLALVVVASIGIGIGVNAVVFSWIGARMFAPIPGVARGHAFYQIETRAETGAYPGVSWPEYRDMTEKLSVLRNAIAFRIAPLAVGEADWSERTYALLVSGNYFRALDLRPVAGRLIEPADAVAAGGAPVVVVSHRFWQGRLAGARDVVGRTLRVNDRPFTIIGVAPAAFQGTVMGLVFDLWVPATAVTALMDGTRELETRGSRGYLVMGDLRAGASVDDARRELGTVMRELAVAYPESNRGLSGDVIPQWRSPRGPQQSIITALAMFQAIMLLVLAVVVGNTANLVLARASTRQRDASVRLALGAGRWRVVSLILSETMLLAIAGALVGALIAVWGTNALRAIPFPTPAGLEVSFTTDVDWVTLAFSCGLGALCGLAIGWPAAMQLSRTPAVAAFRAGGATGERSRMRDGLLALEVALAVVVLAVAAMFLQRFQDSRANDPGFRREGVLLAAYDLAGRSRSVAPERVREFAAQVLERLRAQPGVAAAAIATSVPLDIHGMPSRSFTIEGRAREDGGRDQALTNVVSPGYFDAMGIPFVQGADFADLRDTAAPPQAVVNEEFVRRFGDAGAVLGRRIQSGSRQFVIAGVVRDTVYNAFGEAPAPFIYVSLRDVPAAGAEIHVRARDGAASDAAALSASLRAAVRDLDPALPLYNVRTLERHVETNLIFQRIPARLFTVLGPVLVLLVGVGIYAVASYAVAQRRAEIGLRLALGASGPGVARMLAGETMRTVALGMAGGAAVALMIYPSALASIRDAALLAGVGMAFLALAIAATWWPAHRASRIDPTVALRAE